MNKKNFDAFDIKLGGIFNGLGKIIDKLEDLSNKSEDFIKKGEFTSKTDKGKEFKGYYGFNVKVGIGENDIKVEPFGNIKKDKETDQAVVHETREPMVDIFEENDHTLIIVEMAGIGKDDVKIELSNDILTIWGEKGNKKYQKEILLKECFEKDNMEFSCNNGVLEIKLKKT